MDEQHIYHHNADEGPRVSVKAEKNTKGWNYEASVSGVKSVEQALELLKAATDALQAQYGVPT